MDDATNKQHDRQTASHGRSPGYPGIDLGVALQRARTLYEREQHHAAPTQMIVRHWGYVSRSGPGAVTLAALKKFGLLQDEGKGVKRMAKLTPLALRIIKDRRGPSPELAAAVREAAFFPKIHQELWDHYDGLLPSDDNLMYELEVNRRFTATGAQELISQFRRTLGFLDGPDGDKIAVEDPEQDEPKDGAGSTMPHMTKADPLPQEGHGMMATGTAKSGGSPPPPPQIPEDRVEFQDVRIPDVRGHTAILRTPMPETEEECDYIEDMIRISVESWKKAIARRLARQREPDKDS